MLVFEERGKPEYPGKNLSEQRREPTTNSNRVRESNPGHIGGRRGERSHHCAIPSPSVFVFVCFYREGSVIADMELTFNYEVGKSELDALMLEATNDGKIGEFGVSNLVIDGIIKGQLLRLQQIFKFVVFF